MGLVLSGFFWTYSVMQMPFGWFVDRVGARISLRVAVVWWSVFTALTAVARSVGVLLGCRLLLGVGEAGAYPSCAKVAGQLVSRAASAAWPAASSTAARASAPRCPCRWSPG